MSRKNLLLGLGLAALVTIWSCSSDGPTQSTSFPETSASRTSPTGGTISPGAPGPGSTTVYNTSSSQEADEEFNCTNVQHVQARFSSPGFVNDNVVGLYVEFMGFPDVNRTLRIWWDEENAPDLYEDVPLQDSELRKVGDLLAFDKVVEHTYPGVTQEKEYRVRVELFLADLTGNCARVRRVTVGPPSAAPKGGGGSACASHPQWMPVNCTTGDWVWTSDSTNNTVASASAAHTLYVGDQHTPIPNTCSLDGTGWVSTSTLLMSGCNATWWHLGGWYTGQCGGHDGDVVRRLAMGANDCYNY
jgi:hypothetical protein